MLRIVPQYDMVSRLLLAFRRSVFGTYDRLCDSGVGIGHLRLPCVEYAMGKMVWTVSCCTQNRCDANVKQIRYNSVIL